MSDGDPHAGARIAVVIPCFNYGSYLGDAVRSALEQEGERPQVVVVDDGSTQPDTIAELGRLPETVDVIRQENRGVCAARNAGLARVSAPLVIVLDADDRLAPGALAAMRSALEQHPDAGYAYGLMRFFGDWDGVMRMPPYDAYKLLFRHTIGLSALMRREVFEATGGFDPAFEEYEDWELWVNALEHGFRGVQVDAVTLEYRRHGQTKHGGDRRRYRRAFRAMREKHASLYRRAGDLARESEVGAGQRLIHRLYWGPRPIPAVVEAAAWRVRW